MILLRFTNSKIANLNRSVMTKIGKYCRAYPLDRLRQFAGWNVEINALQDALTTQRFFHPDEFDHGYSNTDVRK